MIWKKIIKINNDSIYNMTARIDIIKKLGKYMFTEENLVKYFTNFSLDTDKEKLKNKSELKSHVLHSKKNDLFDIMEKDKFFWCFYIIHYKLSSYEQIHNKFVEEKKIKFEMVEAIRKHKDILKKNKWKKTKIEDELVNQPTISMETFIALLTIFNYSFVIKKNNMFFQKIIHDDIEQINLIIIDSNSVSICFSNDNAKMITEYQEKLWNVEKYNKPLKSISKYKIKELKDISEKLCLNIEGLKKKEIYALISQNIDTIQ